MRLAVSTCVTSMRLQLVRGRTLSNSARTLPTSIRHRANCSRRYPHAGCGSGILPRSRRCKFALVPVSPPCPPRLRWMIQGRQKIWTRCVRLVCVALLRRSIRCMGCQSWCSLVRFRRSRSLVRVRLRSPARLFASSGFFMVRSLSASTQAAPTWRGRSGCRTHTNRRQRAFAFCLSTLPWLPPPIQASGIA